MIEFILLISALICADIAYYCIQRKKIDEQLKNLEKDMLNKFNIKK